MHPLLFLVVVAEATFDVYDNADNVHLRRNSAGVTDLGRVGNASACEKACVLALGADPTKGCTSFTFYHADYYNASSELAGHCFGDVTGAWFPFYSTYVNPMSASPACFWETLLRARIAQRGT